MATKAQQREERMYRFPASPITWGRERFRFIALRQGQKALNIDHYVTTATWLDETASLTGSIGLTVPRSIGRLPIRTGHVVVCQVDLSGSGRWHELWRMRITSPQVSPESDGWTMSLGGDLTQLSQSKADFKYRTGKHHHKRGWRADQIARDVCADHDIKLRAVVQGTHYIKRLIKRNTSPIEVIREAYAKDAKATGKRYLVEWRNGLVIRPMRYPTHMYLLGRTILTAQVTESMKAGFATAVTVRNTVGKKHKRHVHATVRNEKAIKRYGYVHKIIHDDDAKTNADCRRRAKRALAKRMQPKREVQISHPGLPQLRRFDALRIDLSEVGFYEVCWVKSVQHTLNPGNYICDIAVRFGDPFYNARTDRARQKRQRAAAQRDRAQSEAAHDHALAVAEAQATQTATGSQRS